MGAKAKINAACGRMATVLPQCGFVRGKDLVATRRGGRHAGKQTTQRRFSQFWTQIGGRGINASQREAKYASVIS